MTIQEIEAWQEKHPAKAFTKEIIKKIDEPLPPEAIKPFKWDKQGNPILHAINSYYIVERLNSIFGHEGWICYPEVISATPTQKSHYSGAKPAIMVVVSITLCIPKYGVIKPNIFGGKDEIDFGNAYKGAYTDALTKACSYIGFAIDVYKGEHDANLPKKDEPKAVNPTNEDFANEVGQAIRTKLDELASDEELQAYMEELKKMFGQSISKNKKVRNLFVWRYNEIKQKNGQAISN